MKTVMKKGIALLVALMAAIAANGASITWGNHGGTPILDLEGNYLTPEAANRNNFSISLIWHPKSPADGVVSAVHTIREIDDSGVLIGAEFVHDNSEKWKGCLFEAKAEMTMDGKLYEMPIKPVYDEWRSSALESVEHDSFKWEDGNYGGISEGSGLMAHWREVGVVPEPTGGMLLLTGVTVLALRRRTRGLPQAKRI